jgi:glycosyltransferase involved in cell wall biosynthesis
LRILLLVEGYNAVGGIAEIVDNLAAEFITLGHAASVASTLDREPLIESRGRLPRAEVECAFLRIPSRKPFSPRHLERLLRVPVDARRGELARLVASWRPDVVNSQLLLWDRYPTVVEVCRHAGVALVQSFHVSDPRGSGRLGLRGLRALSSAAAFVAGSSATRDYFGGLLAQAQNARVAIGGVDARAAWAARPHARSRPYIICACRLDLQHKAVDVLIKAFALIGSEFPEVDLLIAGEGPDRARIDELIRALSIAHRVQMLGNRNRDQLRGLYRGALFFALPSRPGECMPVVYFEAFGAGISVVATNTGGAREVIKDEVNGYLVEEENLNGFAEAMARLLRDPAARKRMGERGRELAMADYTWTACAERYVEVFVGCTNANAATS